MLLVFFGCMRPDDENLWSVSIENTIQTDGFARDVYLQGDTAFIAAGQSGVQVWNLQSSSLLNSTSHLDLQILKMWVVYILTVLIPYSSLWTSPR